MTQWRWSVRIVALGLILAAASWARADRVPTSRTITPKSTGARRDISVPYTTNGRSNFGVYQGVAPKIYGSPIVDDTTYPQSKPVYNLPFWGAEQAFGSKSNGATPKPR